MTQPVVAERAPAAAATVPNNGPFRQMLPFTCVIAYWLINLLLISPTGNFPLNDDWIYSESVSHLLQTGQFHLLGCSPSCVLHVALGAAASVFTGFSHEHLRLLTDFFALGTSLVLYITLIGLGMERRLAALSSLVLLANPLFVNLSFSFMTDVPALLFGGIYALCMLLALQKNSPSIAALAGLSLCAAILVRQTFAVFVVPCLLLLLFARFAGTSRSRHEHLPMPEDMGMHDEIARRSNMAMRLTMLTFGVVAPLMVAVLAERLMLRGNEFAAVYDWYKEQFSNVVHQILSSPLLGGAGMLERTFKVFCYFGLFFLPLMPFLLRQFGAELRSKKASTWLALGLAGLISVPSFIHTVILSHELMPFSNNLWRMPMVGPINLMGICVAGLKTRQRLYVTIAASVLALILLAAVVRCLIEGLSRLAKGSQSGAIGAPAPFFNQQHDRLFICAFAVTAVGLVALQTGVLDYDRYYLTALPSVLMTLSLWPIKTDGRLIWLSSVALCLALAAYSTLSTQDYLSWNRARWQAIRELESAGVKPSEIDGGPEYNYLVNPELIKACRLSKSSYAIINRGAHPMCDWRWWSVSGEKYIISFNTIPGYDVVAKHSFVGGLTLNRREIFTLKQH